jgi:tetratricopeptide (TPR) repeat protein
MNRRHRRAQNKKGVSAHAEPFATQRMLADAVQHHRAGRLTDAKTLYRQILMVDPHHSDGLHLLGVIAHQSAHYEEAAHLIGRAIVEERTQAEFHYNLGNTFIALSRMDEAAKCFRAAVDLYPAGSIWPYSRKPAAYVCVAPSSGSGDLARIFCNNRDNRDRLHYRRS